MEGGREYARSHHWITFKVDLGAAGPRTWALLGEAVAGCRQVAQAALPPGAAAETPALARSYAAKTDKTLTRDLNWLRERDLVARTAEGYRARVERMRGFQPDAAQR